MAHPNDTMPGYTPGYQTDPYAGQTNYGVERRDAHGVSTMDHRYERRDVDHRRPDNTVTAGPFQFGLREAILGILALFAILGLVLGVLGFAAAFALDNAADAANNGGTTNEEQAALGAAALPAILVSLLPFLAAPVLALGCGAWAGHASRSGRIGSLAGAIGGFAGPILTLLITGIGFALGAGAANLNLDDVQVPGGFGIAPGWANTIPYLFTGAGLLWLLANALSGGLSGGVVGSLLDRRFSDRAAHRRRAHERRTMRY